MTPDLDPRTVEGFTEHLALVFGRNLEFLTVAETAEDWFGFQPSNDQLEFLFDVVHEVLDEWACDVYIVDANDEACW